MRIFLSAGEPSGDLHGSNLCRELQRSQSAGVECVGFGGPRMVEAGCRSLFPIADNAIMGFVRAAIHAPRFLRMLRIADKYFREQRPDAAVVIDLPGFHWWLARLAKARGIPVYYFMPPQMWGWAGWRVKKMRRYVSHVLCSLTFEQRWYADRGVNAHYVGHPYFDELSSQRLDSNFVAAERIDPRPIIAILPGSRTTEVEYNFSTQLRAARQIHRFRPDVRFLVASFNEHQREMVQAKIAAYPDLPIQTHVGRTAEIIELAHSCISVSGSVSLELLYRQKPTCIVYRTNPLYLWIAHQLKTVPYITLVNLLADQELYPEFLSSRNEAEGVSMHVLKWLSDDVCHRQLVEELGRLKARVAQPGACARSADYILRTIRGDIEHRQVA